MLTTHHHYQLSKVLYRKPSIDYRWAVVYFNVGYARCIEVATRNAEWGSRGTATTSWATPAPTAGVPKPATRATTAVQSVSQSRINYSQRSCFTGETGIYSDKTAVQSGGSVTFSWSSAGATSCVFNPGNWRCRNSKQQAGK